MSTQKELYDFEEEEQADNQDFIHVLTNDGTVIEVRGTVLEE